MELRPYQQELIDRIKQSIINGSKSVCAVLGCGGGKSVIQGVVAKNATAKGNRVLFLVHRKELCEQIQNTFSMCGVDFSLCDVSMVQTVTRRIKTIPEPSIIITDECHHCLSSSYIRIYESFPKALRLGFTATPMRMNEGGLGKVFDELIAGVKTTWLIDNNYLSPYRYFSVKVADLKGLRIKCGDYDIKQVSERMEKQKIYGDTVNTWMDKANGKKTIIYCASIKASKDTVEEFKKHNILAEHLDGETPTTRRREVIEKFRSGEVTVLSNVDLFGEGFDVPDCECVILLRPTKSLTLFIQQSMRSMRYREGKTAIIIDHVGNVHEHGFPDDEREWSLKSKKAKPKCKVLIRECPKCFHVMRISERVCGYCGFTIVNDQVYEVEKINIELEELKKTDRLKLKPHDYYKTLKTFEQVREFQKAKGYKFAWTLHKCTELRIKIPSKYNYMRSEFLQ